MLDLNSNQCRVVYIPTVVWNELLDLASKALRHQVAWAEQRSVDAYPVRDYISLGDHGYVLMVPMP